NSGCGTVWRLDAQGNYTVMHAFTGADGTLPSGPLLRDGNGNLLGTATAGGNGFGLIFDLDGSGNETVLYTFTGLADGGFPNGGLVRDKAGNLYGTTNAGGNLGCGGLGCGVAFKVNSAGREHGIKLYNAVGTRPFSGLVQDSSGNLFGASPTGGIASPDCGNS